jgi:glycine cleavage system H protein
VPQQLSELRFAKSHEWINSEGRVGISNHAQSEITDVVFVELPKSGRAVKTGEACAVVESVKAAFDIYAPVSGTISKVNEALSKDPGLINREPYGSGWLFEIQAANPSEKEALMTSDNYEKFIKENPH